MEIATVTTKGQVTVPKRIRNYLGLDTGAKIIFVEMDDGSVRMVNADRNPGEPGGLSTLQGGAMQAAEPDRAVKKKRQTEKAGPKTAVKTVPKSSEAQETEEQLNIAAAAREAARKQKEKEDQEAALKREEENRAKRPRDLNSYLL